MNWIIKLLLSAVSVIFAAYVLKGVHVDGFLTAIIIAFVISILNIFLRPVLIVLTIPITLVTFGLFLLVINAIIVLLAETLISGFVVDGIGWAIVFSLIVSFVNYVLGVKQVENQA
ncbi:MAG: phage holin family protein [Alphaproteobacteria bacterium]